MRRGLLPTLLVAMLASGALSTRAWAKAGGLAVSGCDGCHNGGKPAVASISLDPMTLDPGASATVTVHVARTNGPVAGFYLTSNKVGSFALVGGPIRLVSPTEATHSSPNSQGTADEVDFQLRWTAPAGKGSVVFQAYVISGNGNNASSGDGDGYARYSITYGCPGITAYADHDGDGYGRDAEITRVCEIGTGFAAKGGDCDDNNADIHPGAKEVCNYADDNCDGQINEGLPTVMLWRDVDGDGYGDRTTTDTKMGCGTMGGYSMTHDDCNDQDREIHPGAPELCDGIDNDCNGRVDDGARRACGTGWCRRLASGCDPSAPCTPGPPRPEQCNNFDDDCDGVIDNGVDLCGADKVCYVGYCLTPSEAADAAAAAGAEPAHTDGGVVAAPGSPPSTPASAGEPAQAHRPPPGAIGCSLGPGAAAPCLLALLPFALALAAVRGRRRS